MGGPSGKKSTEAATTASSDVDGSGGEEEAARTDKIRSGRPRRHVSDDDVDEVEDTGKAEEGGDGVKPVVPSKDVDPKSPVVESNGGKKRPRRRRRPQRRHVKRSSGSAEEDGKDDGGDRARAKSNGFRRNGSRRKSTPRRAAEAGVECVGFHEVGAGRPGATYY